MACEVCGHAGVIFKDHCHTSGNFRGMLCNSCNVSLSLFDDDPVLMIVKAEALELEYKSVVALKNGDNLGHKLLRAKAEVKKVRATIFRNLAEYISKT